MAMDIMEDLLECTINVEETKANFKVIKYDKDGFEISKNRNDESDKSDNDDIDMIDIGDQEFQELSINDTDDADIISDLNLLQECEGILQESVVDNSDLILSTSRKSYFFCIF